MTVRFNSQHSHRLELDSIHATARGHVGSVVVPAIAGLVDLGAFGREKAVEAAALSLEVMAYLSHVFGPGISSSRAHATTLLGPCSAVAGIGRALGWSADAIDRAMSAALFSSAGTTRYFGTDLKALQVGYASERVFDIVLNPPRTVPLGLWSDELLSRLGPGQRQWIDGTPLTAFGARWSLDMVSVEFKRIPCCGYFNDVLVKFAGVFEGDPMPEYERIEVEVPVQAYEASVFGMPASASEANFALPYLLAGVVREGRLRDFYGVARAAEAAVLDCSRVFLRPVDRQFVDVHDRIEAEYRVSGPDAAREGVLSLAASPEQSTCEDLKSKWSRLSVDGGVDLQRLWSRLYMDLAEGSGSSSEPLFPCLGEFIGSS